MSEYIGHRGLPGELKHLSSLRKIKKMSRLSGQHSLSSGERNGNSPKSHLLRIGNNKFKLIFGNWKEEEIKFFFSLFSSYQLKLKFGISIAE